MLFTPQELTDCADGPPLDVLTFLQQPVERIQTYQTLLKVSSQLPSFKTVYETLIIVTFLKFFLPSSHECIFELCVYFHSQELIKNKAKSGQSCCLLEDTFSMVSCLPWRSDNLHQASLIENYPAPLTALGEPVRQVNTQDVPSDESSGGAVPEIDNKTDLISV